MDAFLPPPRQTHRRASPQPRLVETHRQSLLIPLSNQAPSPGPVQHFPLFFFRVILPEFFFLEQFQLPRVSVLSFSTPTSEPEHAIRLPIKPLSRASISKQDPSFFPFGCLKLSHPDSLADSPEPVSLHWRGVWCPQRWWKWHLDAEDAPVAGSEELSAGYKK